MSIRGDTNRSSIGRFVGKSAVALFLSSAAMVLLLRFVSPPFSAVMAAKRCEALFSSSGPKKILHHWVAWEDISPHAALAVTAAEDQKFPSHFGFDFESIVQAVNESKTGKRLRGASTITQQTAKNLFLWDGRSFLRKGLEAYFSVMMELLWPKRRILEMYLNIAEFGDGVYGVGAAAKSFFGKEPSQLTKREAALLAAVLPNPVKLRVKTPSAYVAQRAKRIERQMKNLGASYLKDIDH